MHGEVGTFRVDIENPARPGDRRMVRSALVDTGAELSWIPAAILESLAASDTRLGGFDRQTEPSWSARSVVSFFSAKLARARAA